MGTQSSFAAPLTAVRQAAAGLGRLDVASLWDAERLPAAITAVFFILLFGQPLFTMSMDWWTSPEAGHGLLLAPVAIWLAWQQGIRAGAAPNRAVGLAIVIVAVAVRCAGGLAEELFSMRMSVIMALVGLTTYRYGVRQVLHWWLPFALGVLAIPLPELVKQALALPLQFRASRMGAALLHMRGVPVVLSGNVIRLPGHELFVTEACSGLRSLTALISVAVLMSALVLRSIVGRVALVLLAIPIAIVVNGFRVFLTGFFVFFVGNEFGEGFLHLTEGWLLFLVSMSVLALVAWVSRAAERRVAAWRMHRVAGYA